MDVVRALAVGAGYGDDLSVRQQSRQKLLAFDDGQPWSSGGSEFRIRVLDGAAHQYHIGTVVRGMSSMFAATWLGKNTGAVLRQLAR